MRAIFRNLRVRIPHVRFLVGLSCAESRDLFSFFATFIRVVVPMGSRSHPPLPIARLLFRISWDSCSTDAEKEELCDSFKQ